MMYNFLNEFVLIFTKISDMQELFFNLIKISKMEIKFFLLLFYRMCEEISRHDYEYFSCGSLANQKSLSWIEV
ncbi:UNVERIFIED_CONTAM: hypothetical protein RMT77_010580 [Armadillidium vulgare]